MTPVAIPAFESATLGMLVFLIGGNFFLANRVEVKSR